MYLFYINKLWHKVAVSKELYNKTPYYLYDDKDPPVQLVQTLHRSDFNTNEMIETLGNGYEIELDYFAMEKYIKEWSASPGSTTGTGGGGYWRGTAYYSLTKENEVLRFKVFKNIFYNPLKCCGDFFLGSRAGLDFVLWSENRNRSFEASDLGLVYLIRLKSDTNSQ